MVDFWFGGSNYSNAAYTDGSYIQSSGIPLPNGRLMANGNEVAMITHLAAYVAGRGGSRSCTLSFAGKATSSFTISSASNANSSTGWRSLPSPALVDGSTSTFRATINGSFYFARGTTYGAYGNAVDKGGPPGWSGTLFAGYRYYLPPTKPLNLTATPSTTVAGRVTLSWDPPSDSGGLSNTGYAIYINGSLVGTVAAGVTSYNATGLTAGTSYTFAVAASNDVTDTAGSYSVLSDTASATAPGVPSAPQNLSATPSTTQTGRVALAWDAPSNTAGGITGYKIYVDGVLRATTTGTGRTYTASGLTPYVSYSFTVRARNAFGDANSTHSAASAASVVTAPGPPTAPLNLVAVANESNPGQIDLSWDAPTTTGAGGITGYNVRFSNGNLIHATTGTGTTYSVTDLSPGSFYTFQVHARNALADAEGSQSVGSNTASAQAIGEPPAPTGFNVVNNSLTGNRLTLSWDALSGVSSGVNVFQIVSGAPVLIARLSNFVTEYHIDDVPNGTTRTYEIRARSSYTDTLPDGYPGNWGGPASAQKSATVTSDFNQTVGTLDVLANSTSAVFNGTYSISAVTPNTISYVKTNPNIPTTNATGTVTNNTNAVFNGTHTITSTPSESAFTFAKTNANITSILGASGSVTNKTNQDFNGIFTVTGVNVGAKTISYAFSGPDVGTVSVPYGLVTNLTNAVYNGTGYIITDIPSPTKFSYAKINEDLVESNTAGVAINVTNRDVFNGTYTVQATPAYDKIVYEVIEDDVAKVDLSSPGEVFRTNSLATLEIKYRSGWAG